MRTDTRPIQITIADLQADAEGINPQSAGIRGGVIVSADGEMIATLTPIVPYPALTPEQIVAIKQAFADAEGGRSLGVDRSRRFHARARRGERDRADV